MTSERRWFWRRQHVRVCAPPPNVSREFGPGGFRGEMGELRAKAIRDENSGPPFATGMNQEAATCPEETSRSTLCGLCTLLEVIAGIDAENSVEWRILSS